MKIKLSKSANKFLNKLDSENRNAVLENINWVFIAKFIKKMKYFCKAGILPACVLRIIIEGGRN